MKIFISWSGERARAVATELRSWISMILQATKPWMSDRDLDSGVNWRAEISKQLDGSSIGIICITPERMSAPWLVFESGAIAKKLDDSRVIPYLIDLTPTDLTGPLSQFQARGSDKEGTLRLLLDINKHLPEPREEDEVRKMFESFWSQLDTVICAQVAKGNLGQNEEPKRSSEAMIEELLILARTQTREILELREEFIQQEAKTARIPKPMSPRQFRESFKEELGYDPHEVMLVGVCFRAIELIKEMRPDDVPPDVLEQTWKFIRALDDSDLPPAMIERALRDQILKQKEQP